VPGTGSAEFGVTRDTGQTCRRGTVGEQYARGQVQGGHWGGFGWGQVEDPVAEPANGVGDVGRDGGQVVGVDRVAVGGQGVGRGGDVAGVLVDHAVRQQLVELHDLFLMVGIVAADDLPAEP